MKTVRLANIITNDVLNGEGICTSVWLQGCPHHCPGCHNPQAWDINGGIELKYEIAIEEILNTLEKNGIQRNLSILGGEPLWDNNADFVVALTAAVKEKYPNIIIYCWTGYTLEELNKEYLLKNIDILIDGKFIQEQRDITLKWRGSPNQRILYKGKDF